MMTQARDYSPVLDRLLTREVTTTVEVPAVMTYAYDALYIGGGDNLDAGTWVRTSDTELQLAWLITTALASLRTWYCPLTA